MRIRPAPRGTRVKFAWSVGLTICLALASSACDSSASSDQAIETERAIETEQTSNTEQTSEPTVPSVDASVPDAEATPASGAYISLTDYQAAEGSYSDSKVVLFFSAPWCSTCKQARSNLEADLSAIPADLAIVLVDFDSETGLRRQYGVTVQHTFVQIDANGNELAKWSGSLTAQEISENTV